MLHLVFRRLVKGDIGAEICSKRRRNWSRASRRFFPGWELVTFLVVLVVFVGHAAVTSPLIVSRLLELAWPL